MPRTARLMTGGFKYQAGDGFNKEELSNIYTSFALDSLQ